MKTYLSLFFRSDLAGISLLKEWLVRENQEIRESDPLLRHSTPEEEATFNACVSGTFKTFLWKEEEPLHVGSSVAVLQVDPEVAQDCVQKGLGKIITPEEAKTGLSYAEAASIRLPPSDEE